MGTLRSLAFLTPGNYPDDDPFSGLDATLDLFVYGERLGFDGAWIRQLGYGRIERLLANLRGDYLGDPGTVIASPGNTQRPRLQPHSPGLTNRIWYGGGSSRSVRWAGEHGLGLLTGNIVSGEHSDDFVTAQSQLIAEFSAFEQAGPIAVGRMIVPLDGADRRTRKRYLEYARSRHDRTLKPHGERRTLFAPDLVGTATEIVERLHADRSWPPRPPCAWSCPTSSTATTTNRSSLTPRP
ncbi:LLM class flavin-dependent oxidoreductase [Actinoplanes derwentensis]|uniref:LLM class flavin-dependent oxidoreductase n=1 Tax=Actinoplanes derwentensis TaxID=113562 RepID=UPI000A946040|nr:LLM class flavin-dependent oxidoreductase [Actinoplanes derwentensis]GID83435.1 hypothetical protein Ade03nite_23590 [Actinoplanes derwentensis]